MCFFLDPGGAVSALIDDDLIATMAPPALRGASRAHGGARTGTSTLSSARWQPRLCILNTRIEVDGNSQGRE